LAIEGLLDHEELRGRLAAIEDRKALERRLEVVSGRSERVEDLEMLKAELFMRYLESPEMMALWSPEQRHEFYRRYGLRIVAGPDGIVDARWVFRTETPSSSSAWRTAVGASGGL
jgi:hypothetical protein